MSKYIEEALEDVTGGANWDTLDLYEDDFPEELDWQPEWGESLHFKIERRLSTNGTVIGDWNIVQIENSFGELVEPFQEVLDFVESYLVVDNNAAFDLEYYTGDNTDE